MPIRLCVCLLAVGRGTLQPLSMRHTVTIPQCVHVNSQRQPCVCVYVCVWPLTYIMLYKQVIMDREV